MASRARRKKRAAPGKIARARNPRSEQRQRLIDACIAALHIYGPSRTTVEKVTAIAKMSPGIVRFYFASKASMLVASLQFLAAEFGDQVMHPVERLKATPVAALELLVDLYLDAEIASPRKVSVWYAFWGEASSRQEYYDICGQKDEGFAQLVLELIGGLIAESGQAHLDADGIALGLIGVLEMTWQDFAFKSEENIDRVAAKRRCMAYLSSVFPGSFLPAGGRSPASASTHWASWVYGDAHLLALEREQQFRGSWQFVGHESQLRSPGDFIASDIAGDRVLVVRDNAGTLRAFRNSCAAVPHLLVELGSGQIASIVCAAHHLNHELDGRAQGEGSAPLAPLQMRIVNGLVVVRSDSDGTAPATDAWADVEPLAPNSRWLSTVHREVAANWKLIVESWLRARISTSQDTWSARVYASCIGEAAAAARSHSFLAPNHWLEVRRDGFSLLQAVPAEPGRTLLKQHDYSWWTAEATARAAVYLASRLSGQLRRSGLRALESAQTSIVAHGLQSRHEADDPAALISFRRQLTARVPALDLKRPPR